MAVKKKSTGPKSAESKTARGRKKAAGKKTAQTAKKKTVKKKTAGHKGPAGASVKKPVKKTTAHKKKSTKTSPVSSKSPRRRKTDRGLVRPQIEEGDLVLRDAAIVKEGALSDPHHVKQYSLQAEYFNAITHALGLGMACVMGIFLTIEAAFNHGSSRALSVSVFGLTSIFLFASSTFYHGIQNEKVKRFMKKLDHCAIYLFIAGSYTPFITTYFDNSAGYGLLSFIWLFAAGGVINKLYGISKRKIYNALPYLVMGWIAVIFLKPFIDAAPAGCSTLLVIGGLLYTTGVFFYISKREFGHSIWHLFVLAGSMVHAISIYIYISGKVLPLQ